MERSTKVKTVEDIQRVRQLYEIDGHSLKSVARETGYSINTVRKIIRRVYGYEGDKFDHNERWKNVGKKHTCPEYISEVDGEILHIQKSESKDGYFRISKDKKRETLHVYEAKKVYRLKKLPWSSRFVVHHINGNRKDCRLSNLSVFTSLGLHNQHHSRLERSMYEFLESKGLLDEFYAEYPNLKLETLEDMAVQLRSDLAGKLRRFL